MKLSRLFFVGFFLSFFGGLLILFLTAIVAEKNIPSVECSKFENLNSENEISYERASIWFWVRACKSRMLLVGSSEAGESHSLPYFLRQHGYKFDEFVGAHRGIKTLGYIMAHDISKERAENLKVLAFINPIYFTPGPALMDTPMVYRTALSVRAMNQLIPFGGGNALENVLETLFVTVKGAVLETFGALDIKYFMPARTWIKESGQFQPGVPKNYNTQRGVYHSNEHNQFSSDIDFNIEPTNSFFRVIKENKNKLQYCLVLLPLNQRFFMTQNSKYEKEIEAFYLKYRNYFSSVYVIDLTDMGNEPYIFADIMHFTEYGSSKIIERVLNSNCFFALWGSSK